MDEVLDSNLATCKKSFRIYSKVFSSLESGGHHRAQRSHERVPRDLLVSARLAVPTLCLSYARVVLLVFVSVHTCTYV